MSINFIVAILLLGVSLGNIIQKDDHRKLSENKEDIEWNREKRRFSDQDYSIGGGRFGKRDNSGKQLRPMVNISWKKSQDTIDPSEMEYY